MKKIFFASLFLFSAAGYAATYDISENSLQLFKVSKFGPTRLSMLGENIVDVFFYPEKAAKVVLHKSGDVFVVPNESENTVYVTIKGDGGSTQDMRLRFVEKQPEPICLAHAKQLVLKEGEQQDAKQ